MNSETEKMLRYKFIVTGRVQGVFFRKFTKQKADELSISGWCRNSSDGLSVEGEVEGLELPVKTMLRWLQEEGSPHSSIDKWDMELLDSSGIRRFTCFEIRK
jgi:acylphosphatase